MIRLASCLKLVEIQTKVASFFPFLGGTLFAAYRFGSINWINAAVMLASMLCIDMAATTLNNYMDHKKARKRSGYGYEEHNAIVRDGLTEKQVITVLAVLVSAGIALGILLVSRTSLTVLVLGCLSVLAAAAYSAGPLPISRTPLGEIFSGTFMGFIIPFLSVIIHTGSDVYFSFSIAEYQAVLSVNWKETASFLLFFAPAAAGIANIMLANNICDIDDDRENGRFTVAVLLGQKKALILWCAVYAAGFAAVIAGAAFHLLDRRLFLFAAAAFIVVPKCISFLRHQEKSTTFVYSVQIFVIQSVFLYLLESAGFIHL